MLGAGRQGLAIADDLAKHGDVTLVDEVGAPVKRRVTARNAASLMRGHDAVVSALPYKLNPMLAKAAVSIGAHFCDLGGNTDLVREALKLDRAAKHKGVSVVPDCGLAPGLGNVLAAMAVDEVPRAKHVQIRCGGLPVHPKGPLGYSLLFSMAGLTNEYTGNAVVLRKGKVQRVEAFTEREDFDGPRTLGKLEAFVTSGGSSTAPWFFRGRLRTYEYKTVRYAGHYDKVRAMIELGLLDLDPVDVGGRKVVPRELFHAVAEPRLEEKNVKDLAILRVDCTDARGRGVRYQMLQHGDRKFTAMEQTTGYPTAVVALAMAKGEMRPGAYTPEQAGFGKEHLRELRKRGLRIRRSTLGG